MWHKSQKFSSTTQSLHSLLISADIHAAKPGQNTRAAEVKLKVFAIAFNPNALLTH